MNYLHWENITKATLLIVSGKFQSLYKWITHINGFTKFMNLYQLHSSQISQKKDVIYMTSIKYLFSKIRISALRILVLTFSVVLRIIRVRKITTGIVASLVSFSIHLFIAYSYEELISKTSYIHPYMLLICSSSRSKEANFKHKIYCKWKMLILKFKIEDIKKFKFYNCKNCFVTLS